jgi:hypothetical protein
MRKRQCLCGFSHPVIKNLPLTAFLRGSNDGHFPNSPLKKAERGRFFLRSQTNDEIPTF